jgi:tagatose-1,6-bisphosphate aldolase
MKQLWFKRKAYGWGWTPATWQGWVVVGGFLLILAANTYRLKSLGLDENTFAIHFATQTIIFAIILIVISYLTGESPCWQWGNTATTNRASDIKRKLDLFRHDGMFKFFVLAFDHRGSFIKMMQEHAAPGHEVKKSEAINLKEKIIHTIADQASGVLIDEDYGLPAYKQAQSVLPYLLPAEKTGYTDERGERITVIERTAAELKTRGAKGVKLLLYVHHLAPSWKIQMDTARKVIVDAHAEGLPVFLEFVLYTLPGLAETSVVATVEKAVKEGVAPDVWKLPYPGSLQESQQITKLVGENPWVLLTGGGDFDSFKEQYATAVKGGASGFVAGRSLWQEATVTFTDPAKLQDFLANTLHTRFVSLRNVNN